MPGFNVADNVTFLFRGVNFVGRPHTDGMQKTEAFRADEGMKASRIQVLSEEATDRIAEELQEPLEPGPLLMLPQGNPAALLHLLGEHPV